MEIQKAVSRFQKTTGLRIPQWCKVVSYDDGNIIIDRKDNKLRVFINEKDDIRVNYIRMYEPDKRKVIFIVGIYRGLQIANNYRQKYADDADIDYLKAFDTFTRNIIGNGDIPGRLGGVMNDEAEKEYPDMVAT